MKRADRRGVLNFSKLEEELAEEVKKCWTSGFTVPALSI